MKTAVSHVVRLASLAACLVVARDGQAAASAAPSANPLISSFLFRDAPIEYAMSLLGEMWGRHIVVNDSAKRTLVRTFLKDIDCEAALKAVCQSHNLWYREDPQSGVVFVLSVEEFSRASLFDEKKFVEVVTLAYPRAEDIAAAIQEAYRDVVVYSAPDEDDDDEIGDISRALDRMDQLQDRSSVLEGDAAGQQSYSSSGRGRSSSRRQNENLRGMENIRRFTDDRQRVGQFIDYATRQPGTTTIDASAQGPVGDAAAAPKVVTLGVVFVSIVRRSNTIVLRSSDRNMLAQISDTIRKLDVPKAQVLLEMRVLQLDITDEKERDISFLGAESGHSDALFEGGFSQGMNVRQETGRLALDNLSGLGGHPVFQILSDHYKVRIKLFNQKGKVRTIATPSLLVADYEASRVFIGRETSLLLNQEEKQSVTSGDNPVIVKTVNAEIQRRQVGMSLVITPKIHADGTVTLRVMQERASTDDNNPTKISYGTGENEVNYETIPVNLQIITSSIVAQSGQTVALGGLMQHDESDVVRKIPWVGDIPYLGALFRYTSREISDSELLVLIRPTVIKMPSMAQDAAFDFVRRNVQDGRNLREILGASADARAAKAAARADEPAADADKTLFNQDDDFRWMPRGEDGKGLKIDD